MLSGSACDEPFVRESFDPEFFSPELTNEGLRVERLSRCGFNVPG
jgi:hypothetical protein